MIIYVMLILTLLEKVGFLNLSDCYRKMFSHNDATFDWIGFFYFCGWVFLGVLINDIFFLLESDWLKATKALHGRLILLLYPLLTEHSLGLPLKCTSLLVQWGKIFLIILFGKHHIDRGTANLSYWHFS